MGSPGNTANTRGRFERTIEDREMLFLKMRCSLDRIMFIDVSRHFLDLGLIIAQYLQSQRHRVVDNFQHPAAGQLLVLNQRNIRFDTRGITVHHKTDRTGGCQYRRLSIPIAITLTGFQHLVPEFTSRRFQVLGTRWINIFNSIAMHLHDTLKWLAVFLVTVEGSNYSRHFGTGQVRRSMQ